MELCQNSSKVFLRAIHNDALKKMSIYYIGTTQEFVWWCIKSKSQLSIMVAACVLSVWNISKMRLEFDNTFATRGDTVVVIRYNFW